MVHKKSLSLPANLTLGAPPFKSEGGYFMPHHTEREIRQTAIEIAHVNPDEQWYLDGAMLISDRGQPPAETPASQTAMVWFDVRPTKKGGKETELVGVFADVKAARQYDQRRKFETQRNDDTIMFIEWHQVGDSNMWVSVPLDQLHRPHSVLVCCDWNGGVNVSPPSDPSSKITPHGTEVIITGS